MEKSYYNENRYYDTDVTEVDIKLEVDTSSPIYTNYEHETIEVQETIKKLESFIDNDSVIREIVDKIPTTDIKKRVILSIEDTNRFYGFCILKLEDQFTHVQIFDIVTKYINIEGKDFYVKLSIKFKDSLLKELESTGHYKSKSLW